MASVTFSSSVGGDNSTVTDDANAATGLANYGYATRLVPALSNLVNVAAYTVGQAGAAASSASAAAASASSALNAPGTNASQTSGSVTIGTGAKTITVQSGKAYAIGQTLVAASAANPANFMAGQVTSYSGSSLTLNVTQTGGSGAMTDLVVSMGAIVSSTLPSQTGNSGRFLTTDGTTPSWNASPLAVANGGTGATTAGAARTSLGLAINSDVQAYNANLAALAGLGFSADKMIYATAPGTLALQTITGYARTLLDDPDAATARSTLGLSIGTQVQAYDAELAAIAGLTSAADRLPYFTGSGTAALAAFTSFARGLIDDIDAPAARGTLGAAASGANGDITSLSGLTTAIAVAQGGTGATDASTARSNLGVARNADSKTFDGCWVISGGTGGVVTPGYTNGVTLTYISQGLYAVDISGTGAASGAYTWSFTATGGIPTTGNIAPITEVTGSRSTTGARIEVRDNGNGTQVPSVIMIHGRINS